jgi:4-amino-4-deoxy-L-arabinose transferase-like glycosyltransferase
MIGIRQEPIWARSNFDIVLGFLTALAALFLLRLQISVSGWSLLALSAFFLWHITEVKESEAILNDFSPRTELVLFFIIFVVGIVLRLWDLHQIPPACWFDEAENGLETLGVLSGKHLVFTSQNNGRGALQFYWASPFFLFFGATVFSLRLSMATLGIITIPAAWQLFRKIGGPFVGLAASAFVAFSVWHITISRTGFDAVMTPLFDVLIIYSIFKAVHTKKYVWFGFLGFLIGLANYGYVASRLSILLAGIAFWLFLPKEKNEKKRVVYGIILAGAVLLITLLPLVVHFAHFPDDLAKRTNQTSVLSTVIQKKSLMPLAKTVKSTFEMFYGRGDPNARHNLSKAPMLDILTGLMFFVGLISFIKNLKGKDPWLIFVLIWLSLPLIFGGMMTEPAPHGLRTLAALMPICFIAANGLNFSLNLIPTTKRLRLVLGGVFFFLVAILASHQYFIVYPANPETRAAFSPTAYQAGKYVKALPLSESVAVSKDIDLSIVKFISNQPERKLNVFDPNMAILYTTTYILANQPEATDIIRNNKHHCEIITIEHEQFIVCKPMTH